MVERRINVSRRLEDLSHTDIEALASLLVAKIQEQHHEFWIDPEQHYIDHKNQRELYEAYGSAKGIFFKIFITAVIIGSFLSAAWGILRGKAG